MTRDVRRTVKIADFVSPGGQRFDAVGIDIERKDEVTHAQFNSRLVTHLSRVRARTDAAIASYRKAIELEPEYTFAIRRLAYNLKLLIHLQQLSKTFGDHGVIFREQNSDFFCHELLLPFFPTAPFAPFFSCIGISAWIFVPRRDAD